MTIKTKRVYDPPSRSDGRRVLVDRIWPRGVKKEDARLDAWMKEIAPSTALRTWFGHDPAKWEAFKARYFRELEGQADLVRELYDLAEEKTITLLFAAKDDQHNNAVALKEYLEGGGKPGGSKSRAGG